jgi:hypothetical protein
MLITIEATIWKRNVEQHPRIQHEKLTMHVPNVLADATDRDPAMMYCNYT